MVISVSLDAAKWQFMFTIFLSKANMQFFLFHADIMLGIWSMNNSSQSYWTTAICHVIH